MIPVLEIGGTHVSAALIDARTWSVDAAVRESLDADASADDLIASFASAAARIDAPRDSVWGVAMPDPFDYTHGIGQFEGVGKFTSLRGVDVGSALRQQLRAPVAFLNDADAFVLGEWAAGPLQGAERCAGITLGTGVGSGWLVGGVPVDPGLPPGGRIHRMTVDGVPLEDAVSRRAIRRVYAAAGGDPSLDVREIALSARAGDALSRQVLDGAFAALGQVVGRCVAGFVPDALVIGGSMSASWDLLAPAFLRGAESALRDAEAELPPISVALDSDRAPLIGAALHAQRVAT